MAGSEGETLSGYFKVAFGFGHPARARVPGRYGQVSANLARSCYHRLLARGRCGKHIGEVGKVRYNSYIHLIAANGGLTNVTFQQ